MTDFDPKYSTGEDRHSEDLRALTKAVDDFCLKMKDKLIYKHLQGRRGWDDPQWSRADILQALKEHIDKGDPVDIANFAMFLDCKDENQSGGNS